MADEVTDQHANQEILSLCLRFVDATDSEHPEIREVFLDFIHLKRATGQNIADAILGLINKNALNVDNIKGQAFDGTSAMASENIGTQACVKAKHPLALYTHCRYHVLNLAVAGSYKQQALRNVIGTINVLYLFFYNYPKRQRYLELVLRVYATKNKVQKLKGLCKTRWVERHDCLETLVTLHKYVVTCLHSMVSPGLYPPLTETPEATSEDDYYDNWKWDRETVIKADGLRSSLTSATSIIAIEVLKNGLHPVKGLNVKLQTRAADIYEAYRHIDFVINEVQCLRNDAEETWKEWYSEATFMAEDVGSSISTPKTTGVQRNRAHTPAGSTR